MLTDAAIRWVLIAAMAISLRPWCCCASADGVDPDAAAPVTLSEGPGDSCCKGDPADQAPVESDDDSKCPMGCDPDSPRDRSDCREATKVTATVEHSSALAMDGAHAVAWAMLPIMAWVEVLRDAPLPAVCRVGESPPKLGVGESLHAQFCLLLN